MASGERARTGPDERGVVVPLRGLPTPAEPTVPPAPGADPVTGLPGRERFTEILTGATQRRRGDEHPWAAVAVLEGVSVVASREGRRAAESLLQEVAVAMRTALRDSDKLARLGEDEFGLLVDAPYGEEAMAALGRLVFAVKEIAASRPGWNGVALSVGVTQLWSDEPADALRRAREALYGVRSQGGGGVAMSTGLR
jgi:diguanylate cyclase (GGDEF)-like protein